MKKHKINSNKINVPKNRIKWLIEPGCVVLVSTKNNRDIDNIMTLSWQIGIHSDKPTQFGIVMRPSRYSFKGIVDKESFVINIPGEDLLSEVLFCGKYSGKDVDKFNATGLTKLVSEKLCLPYIEECVGYIECSVVKIVDVLEHKLIVGEAVNAKIKKDCFDGYLIPERARTIHYFGDDFYGILDNRKRVVISGE